MIKIQPFYQDRFDKEYLKVLYNLLDPKNLVESSVKLAKPDSNFPNIKREVQIGFCGLASNTLLNNEHSRGDLNENDHDEVTKLRNKIQSRFIDLFDEDLLLEWNKAGIRLRVRFCFQYLYSDYPISLIKCAQNREQEELGAFEAEFQSGNALKQTDIDNHQIAISQRKSLEAICNLLGNKPHLQFANSNHTPNIIQVRFPVIPSSLCCLIINRLAIVDPYLYAGLDSEGQISVHFPLNIINGRIDDDQIEKYTSFMRLRKQQAKLKKTLTSESEFGLSTTDINRLKHYESIESHFKYLWWHDLTLYCRDSTNYKTKDDPINKDYEGLIYGLSKIKPADDVIGKSQWMHKIRRKVHRYVSKNNIKQIPESKEVEALATVIKQWKSSNNFRFMLCTQKVDRTDTEYQVAMQKHIQTIENANSNKFDLPTVEDWILTCMNEAIEESTTHAKNDQSEVANNSINTSGEIDKESTIITFEYLENSLSCQIEFYDKAQNKLGEVCKEITENFTRGGLSFAIILYYSLKKLKDIDDKTDSLHNFPHWLLQNGRDATNPVSSFCNWIKTGCTCTYLIRWDTLFIHENTLKRNKLITKNIIFKIDMIDLRNFLNSELETDSTKKYFHFEYGKSKELRSMLD